MDNNRNRFKFFTLLMLAVLVLGVAVFWVSSWQPSFEDGIVPTPTAPAVTVSRTVKTLELDEELSDIIFTSKDRILHVLGMNESKLFSVNSSFLLENQITLTLNSQKSAYATRLHNNTKGDYFYVITKEGKVARVAWDTYQIQDEVNLGSGLTEMAGDALNKYLFITNDIKGFVHVIDLNQFKEVKKVKVGGHPENLTVDPSGHFVYVADRSVGIISVISVDSLTVVDSIAIDGLASRMLTFPGQDIFLVLYQDKGQLAVFDQITNEVIKTINVVEDPSDLIVNLDKRKIYVLSFSQNAVGIIDLDKEKMTEVIKLGSAFENVTGLNRLILNDKKDRLYVTNIQTGQIYEIAIN